MASHAVIDLFQRIPFVPATDGRVESHSGLTRHYPVLHANLVLPEGVSRSVGIVMAHPASNFLTHFLLRGFAERGVPAMAVNTRYSQNEPALIMERAADDLGRGVRWMRDELGFDTVVLLGFSGGGSLAAYYQSLALDPGVVLTPTGDEVDLTHLVPADALALVGAHPGRARVLRHWIDGAVLDEDDPFGTDPALDLYAPARALPLDRGWVEAYREAQLHRMRRIDARATEGIARVESTGGSDLAMVVHRTVADPRFVDVSLDPSDRLPGSMYGDPRTANTAAGGLARFVTARSWLSTWSVERTAADATRNLTTVTTPTLVASLRGDQAAFVSESRDMAAASADPDVRLVEIDGLNHYLVDQPGGVDRIVDEVTGWLTTRGIATRAIPLTTQTGGRG